MKKKKHSKKRFELPPWIDKPKHMSYLDMLYKFCRRYNLPEELKQEIADQFLKDPEKYFRGNREEFCFNPHRVVLRHMAIYFRKQKRLRNKKDKGKT